MVPKFRSYRPELVNSTTSNGHSSHGNLSAATLLVRKKGIKVYRMSKQHKMIRHKEGHLP